MSCKQCIYTEESAPREALEGIPETGFAVADGELAPELCGMATLVRDMSREVVAALSMAAHSSQGSLAELVDALSPHLTSTADRISARLGYRRDDEVTGHR